MENNATTCILKQETLLMGRSIEWKTKKISIGGRMLSRNISKGKKRKKYGPVYKT